MKNGVIRGDSRKEDSIIRAKGYDIRLEEDLYIAFNSKKEDAPYRVYNNGLEKNFGEYILKNEKEHFYPGVTNFAETKS